MLGIIFLFVLRIRYNIILMIIMALLTFSFIFTHKILFQNKIYLNIIKVKLYNKTFFKATKKFESLNNGKCVFYMLYICKITPQYIQFKEL